ncbi:MAG: hypothetical protein ACYC9O_11165 [Candidatus Latescibacterota bacterium]
MMQKHESTWAEYKFTPEETQENGLALARKLAEREAIGDQLASIKSEFKAKGDIIDAEIRSLREKVSTGREQRLYRCIVTLDLETKQRLYFDVHTGLQVKAEPLRAEDYQTELFENKGE